MANIIAPFKNACQFVFSRNLVLPYKVLQKFINREQNSFAVQPCNITFDILRDYVYWHNYFDNNGNVSETTVI